MNITELKNLITDNDGKMHSKFKRAKFLQMWRKHIAQDDDALVVKNRWQKLLKKYTRDGMVGIIVHNRCHVDHVNWSHSLITKPHMTKFQRMLNDHDTEISRTFEIVTPDAAKWYDDYERDLIMESHENGHAHVVHA